MALETAPFANSREPKLSVGLREIRKRIKIHLFEFIKCMLSRIYFHDLECSFTASESTLWFKEKKKKRKLFHFYELFVIYLCREHITLKQRAWGHY